MTGSPNLHELFGLEPADPVQPGGVDVSVDAAACLVAFRLASDAGAFEVAMEPAVCQLGLLLVDRAMRACRGARDARRR
jgi:hypothetical protein